MSSNIQPLRRGRKSRILDQERPLADNLRPIRPGMSGGGYSPLSDHEIERVHDTALGILEKTGLAGATSSMIETVTSAGGILGADGRLRYPRSLVDDVIGWASRSFIMHGLDPKHDMHMQGKNTYFGTSGAAPYIVDIDTGFYRQTVLSDLYDIARLVDTQENIHYYWRSVVAGDMQNADDLDINTAYACIQGTSKHVGLSFMKAENLERAVNMFDMVAGGEGKFRQKPFCTISCCHVVPPLRFATDACHTLETAVRLGVPTKIVSASQAGATSPSALAGSIVQTVVEVLAGLVFTRLLDPHHPVIFAALPFVTDLRTGAMSGGSGEQALLMAGTAQMARFYGMPSSICAAMTDSKIPDAQSGAEKGYTLAVAAVSGANMVSHAAGMQASLLGTALESYVLDNDTVGACMRIIRGIEVTEETLSASVIENVALGDGHYLGQAQTLTSMHKDYLYPHTGDRNPPDKWEESGSLDARTRAKDKVREILSSHFPHHISRETDDRIREKFRILLPQETIF